MLKYCSLLLLLSFLLSCSDKNEDVTETVNKDGAIETAVAVTHLDSTHDILTTSHKVWVKNGLYRTVEYRDTLPTLGTSNSVVKTDDGEKNATIKKDYEIYITIK
jgi:ethanolamine ammonia-lyase large subunit